MAKDARVHLFHGDDAFAVGEARKQLEAAVLDPAWREFNLTVLGPDASAGQAVAAVMTMPFGAGGRLVVVKDAAWLTGKSEDPGVQDLEALLAKGLPPTAHLLLLAAKVDGRLKLTKAIAAAGEVREFGEAKPWQVQEQLGPWVTELCHARRRRIDPSAVSALLAATGADRWKIQREVEKLTTACPEGERISAELVRELVATGDTDVFALTDALARKDAAAAFGAIGRLLVGEHPLKVLAACATIMRGWARIKQLAERGLDARAIAKETNARSDFKIGKDLQAIRAWKAQELTAALDALLEVDLAIKEGRWPPDAHRTLLERAIAQMLTVR